MYQPLRTLKSLTVQRLHTQLNEALYTDTNRDDIEVVLVAEHDKIAIYEMIYGAVWNVIYCDTADQLYYQLRRLTNEARWHSSDTWYDLAERDLCTGAFYN